MPANFQKFKQDIIDYLEEEDDSKTLEKTAAAIVTSYVDNVVANGTDPLTSANSLVVLPPKQTALEQGFVSMFNVAFETNTPANLGLVAPQLVAFWTGGLLGTTGIVPGTIQTVSAAITVPGVPVPIPFPPATDNANEFVDVLEIFFKTHLTTVSGLIVGLVPAPPAPPVPTPFPFVGYI